MKSLVTLVTLSNLIHREDLVSNSLPPLVCNKKKKKIIVSTLVSVTSAGVDLGSYFLEHSRCLHALFEMARWAEMDLIVSNS